MLTFVMFCLRDVTDTWLSSLSWVVSLAVPLKQLRLYFRSSEETDAMLWVSGKFRYYS